MFEKEIRELFNLVMAAMGKTNATIYFEISNYGTACAIRIWNEGFVKDQRADGRYDIFYGETLKCKSERNYEKARAHLIRLIREDTGDGQERDTTVGGD